MKGANRIVVILSVYIITVVFICALMAFFRWLDDVPIKIFWKFSLIASAVIVGTQVVFIIPLVNPPSLTWYGKSLKVSMVFVAFMGALFSIVLAFGVFSFVVTIAMDVPKEDSIHPWVFLSLLGIAWLCWSILLLKFVLRKNRDASPLVRLTSRLFAGTLVELLFVIPLHIMVERRSFCYCDKGSFYSLTLSTTAVIWLFGPFMIILLYWRKRPWAKDHCLECGYPRKVTCADVCSECGTDYS